MASMTAATGTASLNNQIVFYQIKEREVGADENADPQVDDAQENEAAAADEAQESQQDTAKVHEISVSAQSMLDCGPSPVGHSPIHSIVWEDLEAMEG